MQGRRSQFINTVKLQKNQFSVKQVGYFIHQNDHEGCLIGHIDGQGHGLGQQEKNDLKSGNHPFPSIRDEGQMQSKSTG